MWSLVRSFLFLLEPESAHRLSLFFLRTFWFLLRWFFRPFPLLTSQKTTIAGLRFSGHVGLAAGFDKNAEWLTYLPSFGYSFAEIGTVTPRPQTGNLPPRLFRIPEREALFNRMGFNNHGAAVIAARLRETKKKLPADFIVGVNVGKNKDTPNETAYQDYVSATQAFEGVADYIAVNVSSPNTPGLRDLQRPEELSKILSSVLELTKRWAKPCPVFVKLAPELTEENWKTLLPEFARLGIAGLILGNTLAGEWTTDAETKTKVSGGWSGAPLRELALQQLRTVRALSTLPIISVGGILSVGDAVERKKSGANLIQIYTGWIYNGPSFPAKLEKHFT